jgi:hypothetical protein
LNPTRGSAATMLLTLTKSRRVIFEALSHLSLFFITLAQKEKDHPILNSNNSLWDIKPMRASTCFWVRTFFLSPFSAGSHFLR